MRHTRTHTHLNTKVIYLYTSLFVVENEWQETMFLIKFLSCKEYKCDANVILFLLAFRINTIS